MSKKKNTKGKTDEQLTAKRIEIAAYFEQGFEKKDWQNVSQMGLPVWLKYIGSDDYEGRFGTTKRHTFEDADGRESRLLCKGNTFNKAITELVSIGDTILINKSEKGYWVIEDIK